MEAERKKLIAEYLRFMISGKEIKGKGYRNRSASKFYEYLRRDADLYNCSVMDVLYRDAELVLNGVFIDLMKLDKTERTNQVMDVMKYKASNFKLNQTTKVYTLGNQYNTIEVRVTKRKADNEITYSLDVLAFSKLYFINKTVWNTTLDHVSALVNSLYEVEERRTRIDKVVLFNEVLEKYR